MTLWEIATALAALLWCAVLLVPWRPWRNGEVLQVPSPTGADAGDTSDASLNDITALIPARDEADHIGTTLRALAAQGPGLGCVVVDDRSEDGTAQVARAAAREGWQVLPGMPLAEGWCGKMWALEQGRQTVTSRYTLLLDADITLAPGVVAALRKHLQTTGAGLVSLLAMPRMVSRWERLLMPAFVFFFKLLYPFQLSNRPGHWIAAAAGGCILLETRLLERLGGFAALRDALIDDCTLARKIKRLGVRTWIGQSRQVISTRATPRLSQLTDMVARTAFTQLGYSTLLLLLCSALMVLTFWVPVAGLWIGSPLARLLAAVATTAMLVAYLPTLRWYNRAVFWALLLPLTGTLFLGMTWLSALRYWRGERSRWKGRSYGRDLLPR